MGWNLGRRRASTPGSQGTPACLEPRQTEGSMAASSISVRWNGGVLTTEAMWGWRNGDAAGNFNVYRAESGEKLGRFGASAVMAWPETYEVNGEQYICGDVRLGWRLTR